MSTVNYKLMSKVLFCGNQDGKVILTVSLDDEQVSKFKERLEKDFGDLGRYDGIPIKVNEETEEHYLKTSTSFDVKLYNGGMMEEKLNITDVGKGSEIEIFFGVGETEYKKKKFLSGFLKMVDIIEFVAFEPYNPFEDDEVETI